MDRNTNNLKTSTLLLIFIIIILLTPPVTILITMIIQCIKQKKKIKYSRLTRILSLDNISSRITLTEAILRQEHHSFMSIPHIMGYDWYVRIDDIKYLNCRCTKEFFFFDNELYTFNIQLNKSCNPTVPKYIFKKLVKDNSYPDRIYYDKKAGWLECTWYGINGEIHFKRFISNMVDIEFKLK